MTEHELRRVSESALRDWRRTPEGKVFSQWELQRHRRESMPKRSATEREQQQWLNRLARRLDLMEERVCLDCGQTDIRVLVFHHIDPAQKEAEVLSLARAGQSYLAELAKCVCVCHNCHYLRHHVQGWQAPI